MKDKEVINALIVSQKLSSNRIEDVEIAAVVCAWLSNGKKGYAYPATKLITDTFNWKPLDYILNYDTQKDILPRCFFQLLTQEHLHNLLCALKNVYDNDETLQGKYNVIASMLMQRSKLKRVYPHQVLSRILSTDSPRSTGFQHSNNCGLYYRYNLLYYWLCYKHRIWAFSEETTPLLPCNNEVFINANKMGLTTVSPTLKNADKLTQIAINKYGKDNFYKLYEELSYDSY